MAKAKNTPAVEESIIEAVDSVTEVETPVEETPVEETPVVEPILEAPVEEVAVSSAAEVDELWERLEAEVAKLGHIGHLYYAEKVGLAISILIDRIRNRI